MGEIQPTDPRRIALLHQCEELCDHCRAGNTPERWLHIWRHKVAGVFDVEYRVCAARHVRDQMESE